MSQYTVEHRLVTECDVYKATDILWSQNQIIREQHPFLTYRKLLIQETEGEEGLLCFYGTEFVGALVIGELGPDSHFPGEGRVVFYTVASRFHPQATRLLYRYLSQLVKEGGGSWYQTTRRVSETEFKSKYRRVHNGTESGVLN